MMKRIASCTFLTAVLAVAAPITHAAPITFSAQLNGATEEPPTGSLGTGTATVIFDADAHTLQVETAFGALTGLTTMAHIHCCTAAPFAGNAGVATQVPSFVDFPLGVRSGSYSHGFDLTDLASWNPAFVTANGGTADSAEATFGAGLTAGRAYLNIHTDFAPTGEIRGFLAVASTVPEPATLALIGAALVGLRFTTRRRPTHAAGDSSPT